MGAILDKSVRGFLADAAASSHHHDNLAGELLFRRHPLEFRFFEQPVFDVEGFLLRQGNVFIDGFSSTHDFDGAVIKLRRDTGFRLILAPRDHPQPGIRITVGFASRIAGEFSRLQVCNSRRSPRGI